MALALPSTPHEMGVVLDAWGRLRYSPAEKIDLLWNHSGGKGRLELRLLAELFMAGRGS